MAFHKLVVLLSALGLCFSLQTYADESSDSKSQTTMKLEDVKQDKVEDIDQEITNRKMRTDAGSKSKYSLSTFLNYSGGAIKEPFSKDRPNLNNDPVAPAVLMTGSFNGRYRIDAKQSLTAGIGVSMIQPFHSPDSGQGHSDYIDKGELVDPRIGYNYVTKLGNLQMINTVDAYYYTNQRSTEINTHSALWAGTTLLGSLGNSGKLQIGLASYVSYTHFDSDTAVLKRGPRAGQLADVRGSQADYGLWLYPFVEYVINDTLNFRTVFRQMQFYHLRSDEAGKLNRLAGDQSVGIGISVSRDVFLYPNFQFSTENLDRNFFNNFTTASTIGMSATINMF